MAPDSRPGGAPGRSGCPAGMPVVGLFMTRLPPLAKAGGPGHLAAPLAELGAPDFQTTYFEVVRQGNPISSPRQDGQRGLFPGSFPAEPFSSWNFARRRGGGGRSTQPAARALRRRRKKEATGYSTTPLRSAGPP